MDKTQGRIDRMDKVDAVRLDKRAVRASIDSAGAGRIGREVVRISDLTRSYGPRTLFAPFNAVIERDDRVGLVGPNGAGKTTLVKLLLGDEEPSGGSIDFGHNVRHAYFSQHATDALDTERTVLETLIDAAKDFTDTQARNYLARFLFTGDDVFKKVSMLSGGEKNKLALARMLLVPCNFLILDEPTNHLDMASCETLTELLQEYKGTLLLVSHDRYLLNAVTNKTLGLTGTGEARLIEGNYAVWREEITPLPVKSKEPVTAPKPTPVLSREASKARAKAQAAVEKAEAKVQALEAKLVEIEQALSTGTGDQLALATQHTDTQAELDEAMRLWEEAVAASS
ncbi:MAG: ATP-binding cassette domain-containing protein [Armatimonas sp.]